MIIDDVDSKLPFLSGIFKAGCSDINGSALLSVTVHNQSFLNPYFSAKYGLILLKSFILK